MILKSGMQHYIVVLVSQICLLIAAVYAAEGDPHSCNLALGLADGKIPDASITSQMGDNPSSARLNGNGAWCFKRSMVEINQESVSLLVDLETEYFISAVLSQGPPPNIKGKSYANQMPFHVGNSTDNTSWDYCCGNEKKWFYSKDADDESDVTTTHSFGSLILARYVEIQFPATLKWAGEDEKCFRFEILGCSSESIVPKTDMTGLALPAGLMEFTWSEPMVDIPASDGSVVPYKLPVYSYHANLSWTEGEGMKRAQASARHKFWYVDALRLMIPGPLWGATYTLVLICPYQNKNVSCGEITLDAILRGCNPAISSCTSHEILSFIRPQSIQAWVIQPTTSTDQSSNVFLSWSSEGPGWLTKSLNVVVTDENNVEIKNVDIMDSSTLSQVLSGLSGQIFVVKFTPQATSLTYAPSFSYHLHIIPWSSLADAVDRPGFGAFITDLEVKTTIHWEGKLLVTWTPAWVREAGVVEDENQISKIDFETEFKADANVYNLTLLEVADPNLIESQTFRQIDQREATFLFLKLETRYTLEISCDYGGIIVRCGLVEIFTELPIKLSIVETEGLTVYVGRPGGEDWRSQEAHCKNGGGTLVTFERDTEALQLYPNLISTSSRTTSFSYFWIGLNMCPDIEGTIWSDGSKFDYNKLPETNSGLSKTSCCIKSEYIPSKKDFTWLGETCDALLPAVCEFHPAGLVGNVTDISITTVTTTSLTYSWIYAEKFWFPDSFLSTICATKNLSTFEASNIGCIKTVIPATNREYISENLPAFTEFNISICPSLSSIHFNGENDTFVVRTYHEDKVIYYVDGSGFLHVVWAEKVTEFGEDDLVLFTLAEGAEEEEIVRKTFKAKEMKIGDLKLGEFYTMTLVETEGTSVKAGKSGRVEKRQFNAWPPCPCTGCQEEDKCITVTDKQVFESSAEHECKKTDASLIISKTSKRLQTLLTLAGSVFDDLWVSSQSLKGTAALDTARLFRAANQETNSDAEVIDTSSQGNREDCKSVSRSQKQIISASDCTDNHYAACEQTVPINPVIPPTSSSAGNSVTVETKVGATYFILSWNANYTGWRANYTVYYQRVSDKVYKRSIQSETFTETKVVISNLERNTEYAVTMEAYLGNGIKYTSDEFTRITSSSNTRNELELGSVSNSGAEWMSAGWSPSPEFFLSNLICGALLITACITTMLLFFATGMFYQDCIAQLGFLFSIMVAFLLLLVAHPSHPSYVGEKDIACVILSAMLHFFYMSAFMFLSIEALTMTHLLTEKIKSPFEKSNWPVVLVSFIVPAVYVGTSSAILQYGYSNTPKESCWVNIDGVVLIVQCVPNGIFLLLTIVLILATVRSNADNQPLLKDNEIRGRQSDSYHLRWVILALALELGLVWASGIAAYTLHTVLLHIIFNASTLLLALTIIFARTWMDDTFRSKIHRLCCGTELTYKRSAQMRSISARTRVAPTHIRDNRMSSGYSTTTIRASTQANGLPMYNLPNSPPPMDQNNSTVLIKRTYKFDDEM